MGRHYKGLDPYAAFTTDTVAENGIYNGCEKTRSYLALRGSIMRKIIDDERLIYQCCSLYYEEHMGQSQIAKHLGISKSSVSRNYFKPDANLK